MATDADASAPTVAMTNALNRTPPTVARVQRRRARAASASATAMSSSGQTK